MLQGAKRLGIKDWKAGKDITVTINWNKSVDGNKFISLRIGKEEVIIDTEELRMLLLMLTEGEKNMELVKKNVISHVREYTIPVTVTIPRDARRGEKFRNFIKVNLPSYA